MACDSIATAGNDHLTDVKKRVIAKGIGQSMDVHDKVYTHKTLKNIKASIEAQRKLHNRAKFKTILKKNISI